MINWFRDKYNQLKAWIVRNGKRILVTLIALATLTVGGLATLPKDEVPYIDFNGEVIAFPYTDDNTDEDLIIRTDREEYHVAGYNELVSSYILLGNNSGRADIIDLHTIVPDSVNLKGVSKFKEDAVYEYEESYLASTSTETYYETSSSTGEKVKKERIIENYDTRIATSTRDEWQSVNSSKLFEYLGEDSIKRYVSNKKLVPDNLLSSKIPGVFLEKGEMAVFRVQFTTDQDWRTSKEFFFEAVGDYGYGHLDPTITAGDWDGYFTITAKSASTTGSHTDFVGTYDGTNAPALCISAMQADGDSIRFATTSPAGGGSIAILDHEKVSATTTAGNWEYHFRIPTFSSSVNNIVYVLCGNGSATDVSTSSTWNSNFNLVDHYEGAGSDDSTSNQNDGTLAGGVSTGQTGKIGNAFEFFSDDESVNYGNKTDFEPDNGDFVVSGWFNTDSVSSADDQFMIRSFGASNYIYARNSNNGTGEIEFGLHDGTNQGYINSGNVLDTSYQLVHFIVNRQTDKLELYIDGSKIATDADISSLGDVSPNADFTIGRNVQSFDGLIDEVRVAKGSSLSEISSDWISTEYSMQSDNAGYWSEGSWQTIEAAAAPPTPQLID